MLISRRSALHLVGAAALTPVLAAPPARAEDPRRTIRAIGRPDAPITVQEWFSLTCTHCAAFARETFPQVRTNLIDTGKLRYLFSDFPLDQIALQAAMVARALPEARYEPFILSLFASQAHWAFDRNANLADQLFQRAALAGMDRKMFDATIADTGLRDWIVQEANDGEKKFGINSTPTFIINGNKVAGEMSYDEFTAQLPKT
jgi:protein-disulfide isomerase